MALSQFFHPRITDYSYRACAVIDRIVLSPPTEAILRRLYDYQKSQWSVHPMTNWQSHRLMLQACIAVKLRDSLLCNEVHQAMLRWIVVSDCRCCDANSQDFHWRDSLEYLVYGLQAYIRAGLYLKPITKYDYKKDINHILLWLDPYLKGIQTHIEYVDSKIASDKNKKSYGKPFHPDYAKTMLRWLNEL